MVNNYAKILAILIRPFVDSCDYNPSNELAAYETYIKIKASKPISGLSWTRFPVPF